MLENFLFRLHCFVLRVWSHTIGIDFKCDSLHIEIANRVRSSTINISHPPPRSLYLHTRFPFDQLRLLPAAIKRIMESADTANKIPLPPRKRARTDEEKEQRRMERILRNRRAAHASREKKRRHVEYLETYVSALESDLELMRANYAKVASLVPSGQVAALNLAQPLDLSLLKANASSCTSQSSMSLNLGSSFQSAVEEEISSNEAVLSPASVDVKAEPVDEVAVSHIPNDNLSQDRVFSYLSPLSMGSPLNFQGDLTLQQTSGSSLVLSDQEDSASPTTMPNSPEKFSTSKTDFTFESPTSGLHFKAQIPAVFLYACVLHFASTLLFVRTYQFSACSLARRSKATWTLLRLAV